MVDSSMDSDGINENNATSSSNLDDRGAGGEEDEDEEATGGRRRPRSSPVPPNANNASGGSAAASLNLDDDDDDDAIRRRARSNSNPRNRDGASPGTPGKTKSTLRSRWLVLGLTCTVMTGSYYAYDVPSALHQQLRDYMPPADNYETRFNLLYTVYSIPNVVLPLIGGGIVDRRGATPCLVLFASTVCAGAAILSAGVAIRSWGVMYAGRFVFGLGAESLCVAQSTIVSDWFEGREVAFAMGIGLAISRLGSIFNNIVSPRVANATGGGLKGAFWIGAALAAWSTLAAVAVLMVDARATKELQRRAQGGTEGLQSLTAALLQDEGDDGGANGGPDRVPANGDDGAPAKAPCAAAAEPGGVRIADVLSFTPLFWTLSLSCLVVYGCVLPFNNVASGILLERDFFAAPPPGCALERPGECAAGYLQPGANDAVGGDGGACPVAPSQAPVLPSSLDQTRADAPEGGGGWEEATYVYPSMTSQDVDCGDPFWSEACASDYCGKQNAATEHAARVMSIPYLISALSSPPLGRLVDRVGQRARIAVLSSLLLLGVHLTLALSSASPVGPMVGQGVAYSLYAAVLWPSVPLAVPKRHVGTAFGVITSIQNVGLAAFPLIIAAVHNAGGGRYVPGVEYFFSALAAAGVAVGILMNRLDKRYGNKLNGASSKVEEEEAMVDSFRADGDGDFAGVEDDEYFSPLLHSGQEGIL